MFERFTNDTRKIIFEAQEYARRHRHANIQPTHLFYEVLSGESVATQALELLNHSPGAMRIGLYGHFMTLNLPNYTSTPRHIPFTPGAKLVLENSLRAALSFGSSCVASEHVLFACMSAQDSVIERILQDHGVVPERVRSAVRAVQRNSGNGQQTLHLWLN